MQGAPRTSRDSQRQIGTFAFDVQSTPVTPENKERWDRRAEALAELLLWLWQEQQQNRQGDPD